MRRLPALVAAPFVVSDGVFVNPRFRGFRLPLLDTGDRYLRKPIRVHDARSLVEQPVLDREGFELLESPIQLDFGDEEAVTTRFYRHCAELVEAATGCVGATVTQHEFRDGLGLGPAGRGHYATAAHSDVSPYVEDVVRDAGGRHFALFNVWKNIAARPVETMPLTVCDRRTVDAADIVYADRWRRTEPRTNLVDCRLIHDVSQCWYYFPRMTADEALILRQYDTRIEDANLRVTFHTAFADPATPEGAPLRLSVEVRVVAVFAERDPDPAGRRARFEAQVPSRLPDGGESTLRHEPMVDWKYEPGSPAPGGG